MRNAVICCIAVALIGLVFLTTNLVCVSATTGSENVVPKLDQDLTTIVIAGIKNNYSKIVSGKGAFRVEQHYDVEPFHPAVRDYTLVFDREKFKECCSPGVDQEHMTPHTVSYLMEI